MVYSRLLQKSSTVESRFHKPPDFSNQFPFPLDTDFSVILVPISQTSRFLKPIVSLGGSRNQGSTVLCYQHNGVDKTYFRKDQFIVSDGVMLCCYPHSMLLYFIVTNCSDFFLGNGPVHLTGSVCQGEELLLHVNIITKQSNIKCLY